MATKMIRTVLRDIDPELLGYTQCHEHLMLTKGQSFLCNPALCIDDPTKTREELLRYLQNGGRSLVDAQPVGCGRDSEALAALMEETGANIIASTGFHKLEFYPEGHWIKSMSEERLSELFLAELSDGMFTGTDAEFSPIQHSARAGIIKTALDVCNLDEPYKRLFRAAASAQVATGAPMMVHIEKGSDPELLLRFLDDLGVRPESLYFCHMDRACDQIDIFFNVLRAGVTLEFDTIGRFKYHSDEYECALIKQLLDNGYEDKLLISLDTTRDRLKAYNGNAIGLDYILTAFLPMLRRTGVSDSQIGKLTEENPKRILSW
ncbi:MAG: hypothetical protein CVU91_04665 [Firmicutes bacterium HGW-Firmicutes-16]|nr:MAG: hypothetical protein CVU91_04665 [Firmicutes bacterium HGW-Firmicutes-16]